MYWPLLQLPDGTKPSVSDSFHTKEDVLALKATREHLGVDLMYRRPSRLPRTPPKNTQTGEVFSRGYYVPVGALCVAPVSGVVRVAEAVSRGLYVLLDAGQGQAWQFMHLDSLAVAKGDVVRAGQVLGTVGFDPSGYRLRHLHLQARKGFKTVKASGIRIDPEPLLRTFKVLERPL